MLIKDCVDKQVNLLSDLSPTEFYTATKDVFTKYPDHPYPTIGEDNWESFAYLISKGTYAGSLIKRLAKWMKKEKGFTPNAKFIGEIGNAIGKTQSKNMESYLVSISNYFDWKPGTFNRNQTGGSSETESCFWQSRNSAREALRDLYDARSVIIKDIDGKNLARCWLISASNDDFFYRNGVGSKSHDVIFNAYGTLELYKIARILTYCGYSSYNRIGFVSEDDYRMYINSDMGFALSVNGEELDHSLNIYPTYRVFKCPDCENYTSVERVTTCPNCESKYRDCDNCGDRVHTERGTDLPDGQFFCQDCFNETYAICWECGNIHTQEDMHRFDTHWYCDPCHDRYFSACSDCGSLIPTRELYNTTTGKVCGECFNAGYERCGCCHNHVENSDVMNLRILTANRIHLCTRDDYTQLSIDKDYYCTSCIAKDLFQLSESVYTYPSYLNRIKQSLTNGDTIIYRDKNGEFAFGLDFNLEDLGVLDADGDSVFSTMTKLIERFKESSLVEWNNVFKQVKKYDKYYVADTYYARI